MQDFSVWRSYKSRRVELHHWVWITGTDNIHLQSKCGLSRLLVSSGPLGRAWHEHYPAPSVPRDAWYVAILFNIADSSVCMPHLPDLAYLPYPCLRSVFLFRILGWLIKVSIRDAGPYMWDSLTSGRSRYAGCLDRPDSCTELLPVNRCEGGEELKGLISPPSRFYHANVAAIDARGSRIHRGFEEPSVDALAGLYKVGSSRGGTWLSSIMHSSFR